MVVLHSGSLGYFDTVVAMFHMPLFFFMSGYCFKDKYLSMPFVFLKKRLYGLYWPFVKWGMIFLFLHNILFEVGIYSTDSGYNNYLYSMQEFLQKALGVLRFKYSEQLLGGYWFLPALFFSSLISFISIKVCTKFGINLYISAVAVLILGFVSGELFKHNMHTFGLCEKWFVAASIYLVGYIFAKYKIPVFNFWQSIVAFSVVVAGAFLWPMAMVADYYSTLKIFPYALTAILGTWAVYSWCNMLFVKDNHKLERLLRFIGDNTMTILTWHFLSFKIVSYLIASIYGLNLSIVGSHPTIRVFANQGWFVLYTVVGMFVPLGMVVLQNKLKRIIKITQI